MTDRLKKLLVPVVVSILVVAGVSLADNQPQGQVLDEGLQTQATPELTVSLATDPAGTPELELELPETVQIIIDVSSTGNVGGTDVELFIDGTIVDDWKLTGSASSATLTFDWEVEDEGNYEIHVTAWKSATANDDATLNVQIIDVTEEPENGNDNDIVNGEDCPAAPAVAAHILREEGIDLHPREERNWIAQVAHHMGSQEDDENGSDFEGIDKCDAEAYEAAVREWLETYGPL